MELIYCVIDFKKESFRRCEPNTEEVKRVISSLDEICIELGGHSSREIKFGEGTYTRKTSAITRYIVGPCSVRNEVSISPISRETHIEYCKSVYNQDKIKELTDLLIQRFLEEYGRENMTRTEIVCSTNQI